MKTIQLNISGKVQGVFYRASAKKVADELDLKGWVRNASNGNVEIIVTGLDQDLERFTNWCHQGPPKASVTYVEVKQHQLTQFSQFQVIR